MSAMPTNIVQFFKWPTKPTLLENCKEVITVEKYLREIGVIKDGELVKDSKDASRRTQVVASKRKDKEESGIETFTCLVKTLTREVFELKQRTVETFASS